jgi:iron-sulfur cluster assembly protein
MLVLTDAAAEVVKSLTSTPQQPDGGLRIASSVPDPENPGALQVTAAPGPSENDQVIEAGGAHVYLEPQAAVYLDDKVLDAQVDNSGNAHFTLGLQGPDEV